MGSDAAEVADPAVVDLDLVLDLRAAIVLRYYCDMSVEDVARALNCSPGTSTSGYATRSRTLAAPDHLA